MQMLPRTLSSAHRSLQQQFRLGPPASVCRHRTLDSEEQRERRGACVYEQQTVHVLGASSLSQLRTVTALSLGDQETHSTTSSD